MNQLLPEPRYVVATTSPAHRDSPGHCDLEPHCNEDRTDGGALYRPRETLSLGGQHPAVLAPADKGVSGRRAQGKLALSCDHRRHRTPEKCSDGGAGMPPCRLWLRALRQSGEEIKAWASAALPVATLPPQGLRSAPGTQAGLGLGGSVPKHCSCPATCRPPPQAPTPWTLFPSAAGRLVTPPPCSGPGRRTATQTGEVGRCLGRS